ncbi:MAG TPA: amidohydrolase family protein [Gemmatimonadales bacterium]|nr:amidohydrolase family protein [Gemmatimonadales bacterium]
MLPIDAEPIPEGAVLIGADGRIAAVGPAAAVPAPPDAESLVYPAAILLPGLVNTHTHLELTGFEPTAAELDFPRWILSIRRLKQVRPPEEFRAAARRGLRACWAGGVTTVADTGDSGAVLEALAALGGSGLVYHEIFGPHPDQRAESLALFEQRMAALLPLASRRVRLGVSPHAPYSVSGPLYAAAAEWARRRSLPLAVHLAESPAERDFVERGMGPFADAWTARGIPLLDDPSHHPRAAGPGRQPRTPVQWLDAHGVLGPDTLCIHAVQLGPEDVELLARRQVAVAHCPLSNAAHRHGNAPLTELLEAGVRVGLGTDSVASVGPLDLLAEARAARRLAGLSDAAALALATLHGARALGLGDELGSLTPGKWGDLAVVSAEPGPDRRTPETAVLTAQAGAVTLTVLGGQIVHRAGPA